MASNERDGGRTTPQDILSEEEKSELQRKMEKEKEESRIRKEMDENERRARKRLLNPRYLK